MPDSFDDELKSLFDAVESPDHESLENSPDCKELSEIICRYEKINLLGQGGLKKVWKAMDQCSHREIAYAEPRDGLHPLFYDLLLEEAWLTASLQHPNIIQIHDVGMNEAKLPFFTMDLKRGKTLKAWRFEIPGEKFDLDQCLDIFISVCEAIEHAHSKGVLHLDLKPENIQLDSFDEVVVCDWGLGRRVQDALASSTKEVAELADMKDKSFGGTPGYMAPEQTEKNKDLGCSTDIYGLGCLLYFILSGHGPVEGCEDYELIEATRSGKWCPLSQHSLPIKVPSALVEIMTRCLKTSMADRYQKVSHLIEDLRALRRFHPTSFQRQGLLIRCWLFYKRQQILCNASILFFVLITVGGWSFAVKIQEEAMRRRMQEQRADAAEEKVDLAQDKISQLSREVSEIEEQGVLSKIQKAEQLNEITSIIKSQNMYVNTVETVDAMEQLAKLSLSLDPQSHMGWHQLAEVEFIRMNTERTKEILKFYQPEKTELLNVFQQVPSLAFSKKDRPSLEQLRDFISNLDWNNHAHILIQRVILYDYGLREQKEDYLKVVRTYFTESFKDKEDLAFLYNSNKKILTIKAQSNQSELLVPRLWTLQCLDIRQLNLEGNFCERLTGLTSLNIPIINLVRHTPAYKILNILKNDQIKKVHLKRGVYSGKIIEKLEEKVVVILEDQN